MYVCVCVRERWMNLFFFYWLKRVTGYQCVLQHITEQKKNAWVYLYEQMK